MFTAPLTAAKSQIAHRTSQIANWQFAALLFAGCVGTDTQPSASTDPALRYLASAAQMGPVAYRDPVGSPSPDGRWLAYTEGRRIVVQPLEGGGQRTLGPAPSQVRYIAWLPDSRHLAVHEWSFDRATQTWGIYDVETGERSDLRGDAAAPGGGDPRVTELQELSWQPRGAVGVRRIGGTSEVWTFSSDGRVAERVATGERLSFPVMAPDGRVACISRRGAAQYLQFPCGSEDRPLGDAQVFGHVAFSPDGGTVYYATPNEVSVLELWSREIADASSGRRLARFARDAYEPVVVADGRVVFKTQDYRVFIATSAPGGGETVPLTTFQSETPTWNWDGTQVSFTFGGWRIATDDIEYPDIEQHVGIVDYRPGTLSDEPDYVIRQTTSEDQGMHWSPNGKWIVYHSHIDGTDDIYLVPTDGSGEPRMISQDGHETGWPRWSPDGRWILYPSYQRDAAGARKSYLYVIPVNQETGHTEPQVIVSLTGFQYDALQAEWASRGDRVAFEAAEGAGKKALYLVARTGGRPRRIHEWESDQVHSGIAVSPDFNWVAFIAPTADQRFQVFRVPLTGGRAEQLTVDPTSKTQPAYSPTGGRLAFTVFSYQAHFFAVTPNE